MHNPNPPSKKIRTKISQGPGGEPAEQENATEERNLSPPEGGDQGDSRERPMARGKKRNRSPPEGGDPRPGKKTKPANTRKRTREWTKKWEKISQEQYECWIELATCTHPKRGLVVEWGGTAVAD